jgi:hypothetical protein
LALIITDHTGQLDQFMCGKADVFRYCHRPKPEFGSGAVATNVDMYGFARIAFIDRKSTRLNSSHRYISRMPSSA